jgi:hypothetical protein
MHENEQVAVALDFNGPPAPVDCALERRRIADLDVKVGFTFVPLVLSYKLVEKLGMSGIGEQIDVFTDKRAR